MGPSDEEIIKHMPMYRSNSSGRTLNQKVKTHFSSECRKRRVQKLSQHYSLKPKTTTEDASSKDLCLKVKSPTKVDSPLRRTSETPTSSYCDKLKGKKISSLKTSNPEQSQEARQSAALRTRRCKESDTLAICGYCDNRKVARYSCEDCLINCCSICIHALHSRHTRFRNHRIQKGQTVLRCEVHEEPLNWYCLTCDHPVCAASLAYSGHTLHDVEKLEIYVKNEKRQLIELQERGRVEMFGESPQ
ncbi:probable E3 ubiquitin-protein ligase MID2 [Argopecten irradians]|uniref:probable E3 ubiquitin-protein ligase MID2 n=1 Tax=Argopecten irradians TaxID=31199 RepID=UPI003718BCD1